MPTLNRPPRGSLLAWLLLISAPPVALAHPWGGLVVDGKGRIFFTFVCPMVGEDHYACVWRLDKDGPPKTVLVSESSPSDLVLARSPDRTIYAVERTGPSGGHTVRLWRLDGDRFTPLAPPTRDSNQFHLQAYAVNDAGAISFAREDRLYVRDPAGRVERTEDGVGYRRIDALGWGPGESFYLLDRGTLWLREEEGGSRTVATGLRVDDPPQLPFAGANIVFDLAVDDEGNVFLAYFGNREVLRVSPSGAVDSLLRADAPWAPHGVDVHEGTVYVLESTVDRAPWWRFWQRPSIVPRVRAVRSDGAVETVYSYR